MVSVAAPVAVLAKAKAKRQDPPWEDKWVDYTCKDFASMFKELQQVQEGEWVKDPMHESYRMDKEKNKCKTKRWVSPDGETLVRVTEWVAPENMAMGHYDLQTCPSNYRDTLLAQKEAKVAETEAKKAEREAKKEAKAAKKEAKCYLTPKC